MTRTNTNSDYQGDALTYAAPERKDWLNYKGIRQLFNDSQTKPEEPDFSRLSKEKGDIAERLKFQAPIATEKFAKEMTLSKI